jgi:hypothetical protein
MCDLPGDLGLTVIDELPEMIGWMYEGKFADEPLRLPTQEITVE